MSIFGLFTRASILDVKQKCYATVSKIWQKKEVNMGKGMDIKKEGKKKPAKTSKEKKREKKDKKKEK